MALTMTDAAIRIAAFQWLEEQVSRHGEVLPWALLLKGFMWHEKRVPLLSIQGIFKPKLMGLPLSVRTAHRGPYDDREGSAGQFLYAYRGTDPNHPDNVGLRELMRRRTPLVYFFGVLKGRYLPAWPVFVIDDNPTSLHFTLQLEDHSILRVDERTNEIGVSEYPEAGVRRYVTREFKARLHQQSFRERVLHAYREQCALCRLRHRELLDAAHIVPDSEPEGVPEVRNGLALCKLHHAAFDRMFIGIRPDLVVEVRQDILDEEDGPMLLHGLKELHNRRVWVPRHNRSRPSAELLEHRYTEFRNTASFL